MEQMDSEPQRGGLLVEEHLLLEKNAKNEVVSVKK